MTFTFIFLASYNLRFNNHPAACIGFKHELVLHHKPGPTFPLRRQNDLRSSFSKRKRRSSSRKNGVTRKNFRQTTRHSPIAALLAVKHDRTVQNIILGSVQHRRHSRLHAHIVDGTGIFHRSVQNFKITVTSLTRLPITQRNVDKRAVAPSHINVHPVLPVGISDGIYTC